MSVENYRGANLQIIIALEGLDGTGKSALANELVGILGNQAVVKHYSSHSSKDNNPSQEDIFQKYNNNLTAELSLDQHQYIILDRSWLSGEATRYAEMKDYVRTWPREIYKPTHLFILTLPEEQRTIHVNKRLKDKPITAEEKRLQEDPLYRQYYEKALREGVRSLKTYTLFRELDGTRLSIQKMAENIVYLLKCNRNLLNPRLLTTSNKLSLRPVYQSWKQRLDERQISTKYISIQPVNENLTFEEATRKKHQCHFDNIGRIFDYNAFSLPRHPPLSIGFLEDKEVFDQPLEENMLQAQDMPIGFPTTSEEYEYRVPEEYSKLREFIQKVANVWHKLEPNAHQYYAYLSVSYGTVPAWTAQRRPSIHCDGFQSVRVEPKERGEYTFVASNALPTVYYIESYDVSGLDPAKDDFFVAYSKSTQSDPVDCQKPYEIIMMDPYCLHAAIANTTDNPITRTFVKLIYSTRVYDRIGNAHNPAFDYTWKMVRREAQQDLLET